jgi:hypothetical protein
VKKFILILLVLLSTEGCKSRFTKNNYVPPNLNSSFDTTPQPPVPDYSLDKNWCALPGKKDMADSVPNKSVKDEQATAAVDVFFIHPTLFLDIPQNEFKWNADVNDEKMNKSVDESSILNQASVFNSSCKIFAPRYRQAHISSFFTQDKKSGAAALQLAYDDCKIAFYYYLKHYNNGRPFIIAGHSQGTQHAGKLIKEEIEGTTLMKQFVTAYLVGMPVPENYFKEINVCKNPGAIICFNSWCTYAVNYYPPNYESAGYKNSLCVNPLSWTTDDKEVGREYNLGGITWKFNKVVKKINNAKVNNGILWIQEPRVAGRMFINLKNYHVADYNLFWFNIRKNINEQVDNYLSQK